MTQHEAILRIKNHIEVHSRKEKHFAIKITEAFQMAVEALEKQIPKKPLNPCGRYYGKAKGGSCPICGASTNSVTYTYCRKCGQALDWSDTE